MHYCQEMNHYISLARHMALLPLTDEVRGRVMFSLCPSTRGIEVTCSLVSGPRSFPGVGEGEGEGGTPLSGPRSHPEGKGRMRGGGRVREGGYPSLWSKVPLGEGVHQSGQEQGYPLPSPYSGPGWRRGRQGVPQSGLRWGYPPPDMTCYAQDMSRAVRLLASSRIWRSSRTTVLCLFHNCYLVTNTFCYLNYIFPFSLNFS